MNNSRLRRAARPGPLGSENAVPPGLVGLAFASLPPKLGGIEDRDPSLLEERPRSVLPASPELMRSEPSTPLEYVRSPDPELEPGLQI